MVPFGLGRQTEPKYYITSWFGFRHLLTERRIQKALAVWNGWHLLSISMGKVDSKWFSLPEVVWVAMETWVDWKEIFVDRVFHTLEWEAETSVFSSLVRGFQTCHLKGSIVVNIALSQYDSQTDHIHVLFHQSLEFYITNIILQNNKTTLLNQKSQMNVLTWNSKMWKCTIRRSILLYHIYCQVILDKL